MSMADETETPRFTRVFEYIRETKNFGVYRETPRDGEPRITVQDLYIHRTAHEAFGATFVLELRAWLPEDG